MYCRAKTSKTKALVEKLEDFCTSCLKIKFLQQLSDVVLKSVVRLTYQVLFDAFFYFHPTWSNRTHYSFTIRATKLQNTGLQNLSTCTSACYDCDVYCFELYEPFAKGILHNYNLFKTLIRK